MRTYFEELGGLILKILGFIIIFFGVLMITGLILVFIFNVAEVSKLEQWIAAPVVIIVSYSIYCYLTKR